MVKKEYLILTITILIIFFIALLTISFFSNEKPNFKNYIYRHNNKVITRSPFNEKPNELINLIELSNNINLKKISDKDIKVAISMHDLDSSWSKAVISGISMTLRY